MIAIRQKTWNAQPVVGRQRNRKVGRGSPGCGHFEETGYKPGKTRFDPADRCAASPLGCIAHNLYRATGQIHSHEFAAGEEGERSSIGRPEGVGPPTAPARRWSPRCPAGVSRVATCHRPSAAQGRGCGRRARLRRSRSGCPEWPLPASRVPRTELAMPVPDAATPQ